MRNLFTIRMLARDAYTPNLCAVRGREPDQHMRAFKNSAEQSLISLDPQPLAT